MGLLELGLGFLECSGLVARWKVKKNLLSQFLAEQVFWEFRKTTQYKNKRMKKFQGIGLFEIGFFLGVEKNGIFSFD